MMQFQAASKISKYHNYKSAPSQSVSPQQTKLKTTIYTISPTDYRAKKQFFFVTKKNPINLNDYYTIIDIQASKKKHHHHHHLKVLGLCEKDLYVYII